MSYSGLTFLITAESANSPDSQMTTSFADWDDAEAQAKLYCWLQGNVWGSSTSYAVIANTTREQYVIYVSATTSPYYVKVNEGTYPV